MFEQDYVMRIIKEMVRAILKLLFNIDTDSPSTELLEDEKEQQKLDALLDMVDADSINEAENIIYEITENGRNVVKMFRICAYLFNTEEWLVYPNEYAPK